MKRLAVKTVLLAILSVSVPGIAGAQQFSVSTNVMGYVDFGTLNMEASYAFARHWSVTAGARFNPFTFYPDTEDQMQRRQQAYNIGIRMWPWHTFAASAKVKSARESVTMPSFIHHRLLFGFLRQHSTFLRSLQRRKHFP